MPADKLDETTNIPTAPQISDPSDLDFYVPKEGDKVSDSWGFAKRIWNATIPRWLSIASGGVKGSDLYEVGRLSETLNQYGRYLSDKVKSGVPLNDDDVKSINYRAGLVNWYTKKPVYPEAIEWKKKIDSGEILIDKQPVDSDTQKQFLSLLTDIGEDAYQMKIRENIPFADVSESDTIGEKASDVVAGLTGFMSDLVILRKILPGAPDWALWGLQSEANGDSFVKGATMGAVFGKIQTIKASPIAKKSLESATLAATQKLSDPQGSNTDVLIAASIPFAFGAGGKVSSLLQKMRTLPVPDYTKYGSYEKLLDDALTKNPNEFESPELQKFARQAQTIKAQAQAEVNAVADVANVTIPSILKNPDVAQLVMSDVTGKITKKTGLLPYLQPDGKFTIMDAETLVEIRNDIPSNKIGRAMQEIIDSEPATTKRGMSYPKDLDINEKLTLKQNLQRLETVSSAAFREGKKVGVDKTMPLVAEAKDKLKAFKLKTKENEAMSMERKILARDIVTTLLPKAEQGKYITDIAKAKTESDFDAVVTRVESEVARLELNSAVDSFRNTHKEYMSMFGDKTGIPFAKAPDSVRGLLNTIFGNVDVSDKTSPKLSGDVSTVGPELQSFMNGLRTAVDDIVAKQSAAGGDITELSFIVPDAVKTRLSEISSKPLGEITADDVRTLDTVARMVVRRSEMAHTVKINDIEYQLGDVADNLISSIIPKKNVGAVKPDIVKAGNRIKKFATTDQMQLPTLLETMFGGNEYVNGILRNAWSATRKSYENEQILTGIVRDYVKQKNIPIDTIVKDLDNPVKVKIAGKEIEARRGDILGLAMSIRDPYNFKSIIESEGIYIGDNLIKGKTSASELADIISIFTGPEIDYGNSFFHLNASYARAALNNVSLNLDNVLVATSPDYYPSSFFQSKRMTANKYDAQSVENQSILMERMGGGKIVKVNDFTSNLMTYIQKVSKYAGMAEDMRSIKAILGNRKVQEKLIEAGYKDELYNAIDIVTKVESPNHQKTIGDVLFGGIMSRAALSALSLRVQTGLIQPTSIFLAMSEISPKHFVPTGKMSEFEFGELVKRSSILYNRWYGGGVTIEAENIASRSTVERVLTGKMPTKDLGLSWMIYGDMQATKQIFYAALREQKATTNLAGEELLNAAIRRTEEVVFKTQQTGEIVGSSSFRSQPGVATKMLTWFRSAQETQYNILLRANNTYQRSPRTAADKVALAGQYTSVFSSILSAAIVRGAWKAARLATIAGVAYKGGQYVQQDEKDVTEKAYDAMKIAAEDAADMIPGVRAFIKAISFGVEKAIGENTQFMPSDPISSVGKSMYDAVGVVGKWVNRAIEHSIDKQGDRYVLKTNEDGLPKGLEKEIVRDVAMFIDALSTVSGVPGAAVADEWIYPATKPSKHRIVDLIQPTDAKDPILTKQHISSFLTEYSDLERKEKKSGFTDKERQRFWKMKVLKGQIDSLSRMLEVREKYPYESRFLAAHVENQLNAFYGE